jgi:4-amino-4-deoxy-L-arabinose transferase-like glycosyltransferase
MCGVLFFYGLGLGELWGTESLRAVVAAEMLRTGDWIVPCQYGEPLLTKPPGMYLAIVLCSLPFGQVTEWTARLPSALAATATVLLIYWYFGRQLGRTGGLVGAFILPLSWLWLEKSSSADIDMLLVFWTSAAIVFVWRALEKNQQHWWLAALLCVAGGFLTKWTTPAFFYAAVVPLLWWRKQLRLLLSRQHLVALGLAAGIASVWMIVVVVRVGWPTVSAMLEQEALHRLVPTYAGRPYAWSEVLLHPVKVMTYGLPFSVLALATLWPPFYRLWDEAGQRLLQGLHCWTWPSLLIWSLPSEHKARFSFPLLPGLSGLAAMVLLAWLTGLLAWRARWWPKLIVAAMLAAWIMLKVMFVHGWIGNRSYHRPARATGELLAELVPVEQVLYVLGIKDDGVMFYFGRPASRVDNLKQLPPSLEPVYCLATKEALDRSQPGNVVEVVQTVSDAQGHCMFLLRVIAP